MVQMLEIYATDMILIIDMIYFNYFTKEEEKRNEGCKICYYEKKCIALPCGHFDWYIKIVKNPISKCPPSRKIY